MRHPMKKALLLLAALTYAGFGSAQNVAADTVPALPPYVYCEIMADHLPTYRDSSVLFDFGQKVGATKYNYLTDAAGNKLLFSSGIEALNYTWCATDGSSCKPTPRATITASPTTSCASNRPD